MPDSTSLPLRSPSVEDIRTIAALTRRSIDDPLIDGSDLQRRWLDIMRRYPGKNSDEIAADFLDALASEREQPNGDIEAMVENVQAVYDILIDDRCCGEAEINEAHAECELIVETLRGVKQASGRACTDCGVPFPYGLQSVAVERGGFVCLECWSVRNAESH